VPFGSVLEFRIRRSFPAYYPRLKPRAPRTEYEDAVYHVMARGNRRLPIVFSDADRDLFAETLAEACALAKFKTYAWILMDNHYHWLLETPKANLVEDMTCFQNPFPRRINARNRLWGHLFGGRYKAILIVATSVRSATPGGGCATTSAKSSTTFTSIPVVRVWRDLNPLLPRPKSDKDAEGMKKQIPSNRGGFTP